MKRRRARELALQMLFQFDFTGDSAEAGPSLDDRREDPLVVDFANDIARGTIRNLPAIDAAIKGAAEHWVLGRMAAVDRNILRAAAYELLFRDDIPPAVTINEALEIAKKYSSGEAASFINGILDKIAKTTKGSPGA
jgi:N utilization substance protein B